MTLTDRQKKLAAVGVGGLVFLVFMLARSRNAANTATAADGTTIPTATGGGTPQADLSGDSSGALGGTSTDIASALDSVNTGLQTIGTNEGTLYDALTGLTTAQATQQNSIDALGTNLSSLSDRIPATSPDVAPVSAAADSPAATAAVAVAAAVTPKTVVKNGRVYHFYDTDPKTAGYERKVYVRPASTPRRSPSQPHPKTARAPAAHHTTKPKRKHRR